MLQVLIVEDDPITRRAMNRLLSLMGYHTRAVGSAEEALLLLEGTSGPVIALIDLDLPGISGIDLIHMLERSRPSLLAVLITAAGPERLESFHRRHPGRYLRKPLDFDCLLNLLKLNSAA